MKKIGILTYFWAHNPGTFLQACATQAALEKKFPDDRVELANYQYRRMYFRPSRRSIWPVQFVRDIRRFYLYEEIKKRYLTTSHNEMVTHDSQQAWDFLEKQQYDLIVVGADTILEFLPFHQRENQIPAFWLPAEFQAKKVACASSAGALTLDRLSREHKMHCRESINGFDLIAVRDEATCTLLKELGLRDTAKLQMIPDPTFSHKIDYSHAEELIKRKRLDFSRPTIALYLLKTFRPAAELAAYYKSRGFQVISLAPVNYGDIVLNDISPLEWASIYKYFSLVVTDRFHGTIYSLKNLTPVVSVVSDTAKKTRHGHSKVYSLLKLFGLNESNFIDAIGGCDIDMVTSITDAAMQNFDKQKVRQKLEQLEKEYNMFVNKIPELFSGKK